MAGASEGTPTQLIFNEYQLMDINKRAIEVIIPRFSWYYGDRPQCKFAQAIRQIGGGFFTTTQVMVFHVNFHHTGLLIVHENTAARRVAIETILERMVKDLGRGVAKIQEVPRSAPVSLVHLLSRLNIDDETGTLERIMPTDPVSNFYITT